MERWSKWSAGLLGGRGTFGVLSAEGVIENSSAAAEWSERPVTAGGGALGTQ